MPEVEGQAGQSIAAVFQQMMPMLQQFMSMFIMLQIIKMFVSIFKELA